VAQIPHLQRTPKKLELMNKALGLLPESISQDVVRASLEPSPQTTRIKPFLRIHAAPKVVLEMT
jgi:hypothetical protein